MKSHALRLYVVAVTLLVFFVLWAVIAARPWARGAAARSAADPRLARLDRRQRHLEHESKAVNRLLARRWSAYHRRLREREALIHRLERRHARQVAAARARAQAGAATATYSATATAPSAAPAARVVTLPPQVKVVSVPPAAAATSTGSSHP